MDSGLAETQFILDRMEYRINQHYGQAQKELEEKINKFYKDFTRLDTEKLKLVNDGKLSMDDYKKWRQAKVMSGKVWEQRKATIAADLHNANDIAQSMIYGYMPDVYAANHNFATYQIEQQARIDTSYTLYNHEAVEKLIAENPDLIPYQRINKKLDESWNKKNIQAVMIQGILQGESIPHLAKRLAKNVVQKDRHAAIRNARTMTTAAQNAGKYDAMERAASLGVNIKTQWRAVLDDRTRDRHRELDGMTVDLGEEFPNGLRYPVDIGRHMGEISAQSAEGRAICAETYNCRCNIKPIIEGLQPRAEKYRSTEAIGIPYEEWKKGHKAANEYRKAHGMLEHDRKGNVIIPKKPVSMRAKSHLDPSEVKKSEFKPVKKAVETAKAPTMIKHTQHTQQYYKILAEIKRIAHNPVKELKKKLTSDEIIARIAGGDETKGSCASLSYAYIANKMGYDVLDFRGGSSRLTFSHKYFSKMIDSLEGVDRKDFDITGAENKGVADKLKELKLPFGKEYRLSTGSHAAIIRNTENGFEYLELQSGVRNGWHSFTKKDHYSFDVDHAKKEIRVNVTETDCTMEETLKDRFGCSSYGSNYITHKMGIVDVDSYYNDEFIDLMGYINTSEGKQKKGKYGHER